MPSAHDQRTVVLKLLELKNEAIKELKEIYPEEEARSIFDILANHFMGMTRIEVALLPEKAISNEVISRFRSALSRLSQHEPVQYVIGETEFYGSRFIVNAYTLIPRSETEELVDWVLKDAANRKVNTLNILDIGTGSGCIAISLAKNLKNSVVMGLDISMDALKIAESNSLLNNTTVDFMKGDILEIEKFDHNYDIIISNPPYVRELEKVHMKRNVLDYEPQEALYVSNEDPLVFYRKIIHLASSSLNTGGLLYFEINEYLSDQIVTILEENGFKNIVAKKDVFGKDRMLKAEQK